MANPDQNTYDDRASVEPTPSVPTPTRIAGRYEILGMLGSGGMGTVYRVRDTALDEVVALKLLKGGTLAAPGVLDRFRQEVRLARKVTHPNVVRTFDLGEDGSTWFLTMEYVDARPLSWRLDGGPMPEDEIVRVMIGVCEGVGAAHAVGVLHRDLKPDNVLVGDASVSGAPGRVAITDFGIASQRGSAASGLAGTPAYMAPEQVEGREVDGRADIYALGAVMFEMATGRRAFVGDDPWAVARMRLEGPPPDPRAVTPLSDGLAEVILRCLAREPRQRFATAAELKRALESVTTRLRAASQAVASSTPAAGASTLAVVPFRATEAEVHLANGLAEELIDLLSVTRGLKVRPLAAVQRLAIGTDPEAIGAALGVDAVLSGALRRSGDRLVLTARLVSVADGFQVWGARLDCSEGELLVQADAIAAGAAGALQERVAVPMRAASSDDVVEHYLRARHEYRLAFESGTFEAAQASAEQGLALAPRDPGLLSIYALICARQTFYSLEANEPRLARGFEAARAAVALAPHAGEAWLAVGALHFVAHEVPEAARALARAVKEAPGLARAQDMLGGILIDVGRVDAGRARLEASIALDPIPVFVRADLARAYAYLGDWARVEAITRRDPDPVIHVIIGEYRARFALWSKGRLPPTWITLKDMAFMPSIHPAIPVIAALLAAANGTLTDDVDAAAGLGVCSGHRRLRSTLAQFLAEARSASGRIDGTLEIVQIAVDAGLYDVQWMDHCPTLETTRADPRFRLLRDVVAERAQRVKDALDAP